MSVPPDLGSLSKPIDGTSRQTHPPNPSNPTNETARVLQPQLKATWCVSVVK